MLLGPFTPTLNRFQAVDFTTTIGIVSYYTIIVPLRFQDNLLSITEPLSLYVWICFLISIPVYIVTLISMNYVYCGSTNWETDASFIIRGALSEHKSTYFVPPKHLYKKCLVLVWSWMMVVLISAYQGNLLALITRPTLNFPFKNAEGMVDNNQVEWGMADPGMIQAFLKNSSEGTTFRTIYDKAIKSFSVCTESYATAAELAMVMDISCARRLIAEDFTSTGICNYYLTQDRILALDSVLAFPVSYDEYLY